MNAIRGSTIPFHLKKRESVWATLLRWLGIGIALIFILFVAFPLIWWNVTAPDYDGYNYVSFRQLERSDRYIPAGAPFPGDTQVYTSSGEPVAISTLWQDRPLVLETGSWSCPIYRQNETSMTMLAASHADQAKIAVLYTREAHPGLFARPHTTMGDKLKKTRRLENDVRYQVFADGLRGPLHQRIGGGPNSIYIIGTDGIVAHYAFWNDPARTAARLNELLEADGKGADVIPTQYPCRDPMKTEPGFSTGAMAGMLFGIVRVGGLDAFVDFLASMLASDEGPDPFCEKE